MGQWPTELIDYNRPSPTPLPPAPEGVASAGVAPNARDPLTPSHTPHWISAELSAYDTAASSLFGFTHASLQPPHDRPQHSAGSIQRQASAYPVPTTTAAESPAPDVSFASVATASMPEANPTPARRPRRPSSRRIDSRSISCHRRELVSLPVRRGNEGAASAESADSANHTTSVSTGTSWLDKAVSLASRGTYALLYIAILRHVLKVSCIGSALLGRAEYLTACLEPSAARYSIRWAARLL